MSEMNLYQKIVAIRSEIEGFSKDKEGYQYSYVTGSQILRKIKAKMDELNVMVFPKMGEVTDETYDYQVYDKNTKSMKDKTDFIIKGSMTYVWMNADKPEETLEIPWMLYGQQDDISKAYGTGLTYSERYMLLKFFGLPTDEDDPDTRQNGETKQRKNHGSPQAASEKQLNLVGKLLKGKVQGDWTYDKVHEHLKKQIGTQNNIESFTKWEASKAIEILQNKQKGA